MIICLILIGIKLSMPPIYWVALGIAFCWRVYSNL